MRSAKSFVHPDHASEYACTNRSDGERENGTKRATPCALAAIVKQDCVLDSHSFNGLTKDQRDALRPAVESLFESSKLPGTTGERRVMDQEPEALKLFVFQE